MYKKVSTDMNFVSREKEVEKFWDENHIFEKSIEERKGCPDYIFYDGPRQQMGNRISACTDPCHQGHDPALPHDEGVYGPEESRMGYPRTSGGTGS